MTGKRACRNCGGALSRRARACAVCRCPVLRLSLPAPRWMLLVLAVLATLVAAR